MSKKSRKNTEKEINHTELERLSDKFELKYTIKENGHIQIYGEVMVNYYPLSKLRTAYINKTSKRYEHVNYGKAFSLASGKRTGVRKCACGVKIIRLWSPHYITHVNLDDKERHFCKQIGVNK